MEHTSESYKLYKKQKTLCRPIQTPRIILFLIIVAFAATTTILIAIYCVYQNSIEYSIRYDNLPSCEFENSTIPEFGKECEVKIQIQKRMELPIFVYYRLNNFYQNYKSYSNSKSNDQLMGKESEDGCDALIEGAFGKILYPCGLIAHSYFSDKIIASVIPFGEKTQIDLVPGGQFDYPDNILSWKKESIAWNTDKNRYKLLENYNSPEFYEKYTRVGPEQNFINKVLNITDLNSAEAIKIPLPTDEDLMVWMKISSKSGFSKLYRKIESFENTDLNRDHLIAGDIIIFKIKNYFRVKKFKGEKFLKIATASKFGVYNPWFTIQYIVVVGLIFISFIFTIIFVAFCSRKIADVRSLN